MCEVRIHTLQIIHTLQMKTVKMVKDHKSLRERSASGIILFRRKNGTWKLKGTAKLRLEKVTGRCFTTILVRGRGQQNNGVGNNLISLTDCSCVHHSLVSKVLFDPDHLVKAAAPKERAQIPIVDTDPAFCSWIFTPSSSVLCRKKKVLGNFLF